MSNPTGRHKVGLLTTLATNVGDDFIREGLVAVMQSLAAPETFDFVPINKHKPLTIYPAWYPLRLAYNRKMRPRRGWEFLRGSLGSRPSLTRWADCDLIVQCGTPIIWDGCSHSEWAEMIWQNVLAPLAASGKPVLNLGGGSSYPWERVPPTLAGNGDEAFVRLMLKTATITTTRDSLAQSLLAPLGSAVEDLGCPALLAGQVHTQPGAPTRKVVINYMRRGGHYDYGQKISVESWRETVDRIITHLLEQGWEPVLLAHNEAEMKLAAEEWPHLPRVLPRTTGEYFKQLRDAHFGLFNRLHASVAAAGLGIPSVAVGTDTRLLMVGQLGLPALYVKDASLERLLPLIEQMIANRLAESQRLLSLREKTFSHYQEILRPFIARSGGAL